MSSLGSSAGLGQPFGEGWSFQQPVAGVNPAAGSGFSLAMDGRWSSRLVSCVFTLTTDVNVANRFVTVEFQGGDGTAYAVAGAAIATAASLTRRYNGQMGRGTSEGIAGSDIFFPLEPLFMRGGDTLAIIVGGIQAGDTLTKIRFVFDRFSTDPQYGITSPAE